MSGERGRAYKADRSFRVDLGVRRLGFRARMTFFIGMLLLGWFEAVLWDSLIMNRRRYVRCSKVQVFFKGNGQ